jgi:amidase
MGGLVCELAVTRTVRDTARILDAVSGAAPGDPYAAPTPASSFADALGNDVGPLRIGLQTEAFGGGVETHPDCVAATEGAARALEALGHRVEPARVDALDDPAFLDAFLLVWSAGTAYDLDAHWPGRLGRPILADEVEPLSWALADLARNASAADFLAARQRLQKIARGVAAWYDTGFDLLLTPTLAEPPPRIGEFDSPADNPLHGLLRAASLVPFTPPFNVTGQPAISLPLWWNDDGLPVGSQLVARYGDESTLLTVAAQLEESVGWAHRHPPHRA